MLKACSYCGRIHKRGEVCSRKPKLKKNTKLDWFRSSSAWQRKREAIRQRDLNLCRMSLHNGVLDYTDLSVHHIEPLTEAWDRRLDDDNLITLNSFYHEQAEAGSITKDLLYELAASPPALNLEKLGHSNTDSPPLKITNSVNEME